MTLRSITRRGPAAVVLLLACSAIAAAPTAAAQDAATGATTAPTEWSWGIRAGLFEMVNAADAYDAVFGGDPMPQLGVQIDARWRSRWLFSAALDYGRVDAERVFLTDPPRGTGFDEELTLMPIHLTAAYRFRPAALWDVYAGAGPSFLAWEDESGPEGASGNDFGGSLVVGVRRQPPRARWRFGGELRWSTFPGALPEAGVAAFFGEDDPGGLSLSLLALRSF